MIFFANRENLDKRRLLSRLHNHLQTQVTNTESAVKQVLYHTATGNKIDVRATIDPERFLGVSYPVSDAELQVSFDFPQSYAYNFYYIQWVESDREFMIGWHQDQTHMDLGKCHLQVDYQGETRQRHEAMVLDMHPMNVFEQRTDELAELLTAIEWDDAGPPLPDAAIR